MNYEREKKKKRFLMSRDSTDIFYVISKRFIKAIAWRNKSQSLYKQEEPSDSVVYIWGLMLFPVMDKRPCMAPRGKVLFGAENLHVTTEGISGAKWSGSHGSGIL